ncbi:MFS transporter [Solimonas terrae]|nr:glycoside-pentoside-hexuronide (GPH):cation symporter [Solimonas terrae]
MTQTRTVAAARPMGFGRKLALGAGDFGFNLYWQTASLYLLFFYTDVLGLPPSIAGAIYMLALIWDAVLDPLIGSVVDRTRSRLGRYRPYLLFGGVPLGLIFAASFLAPTGDSVFAIAVTATLHVAFRTLYAAISIPYSALFARVTQDARVRAELAGFRMVCATLGALIVAGGTLPFVKAFSTPEAPRLGWTILGLAFGVVASLLLLVVAWAARGYDDFEVQPAPRRDLQAMLRSLLANRALLIVLGAVMVSSFANTLFGKNLLYYFKYIVGRAELASAAMALVALGAAVLVPLFAWIARTRGKRATWLIGSVPSLIGMLLWRLGQDGSSLPLLFTALGLYAFGTAAYVVCFWSMLPDTVEYGEWKSGVRTESLVFGLGVLGQKFALGLGAGFLGIALAHVGYVANAEQTPETIAGIKAMMFWFPLGGWVVSVALIAFYPLGLKEHARIVEEIAARRLAASPETLNSALGTPVNT